MTSSVIACASRRFCCSDLPGHSFTITCGMPSPSSVLLVGDVFEPIDGLAIELLLHGDVRHRRGRRRAVPVLFARGEPHHVAGANLFNGSAPALDAAEPGCHDQRLAERMGVPGGARAWLECHGRTRSSGGRGGLKQRIDTDRAGKPVTGSLLGRLRTCSSNLHGELPFNVLSTPNLRGKALRVRAVVMARAQTLDR